MPHSNVSMASMKPEGKSSPLLLNKALPKRSGYQICGLVLLLLAMSSCTEDPPPVLDYREREAVDSLFRKQVDSLRPILDSLCEARYDSALQHNVDSMMTLRRQEIQRYLERVWQETQQ